ncbi:MAG: hypothetical protein QOD72_148 [Acidimicrobiaceae bacterium]|jgi:hypothetical protein|nr:hypothetical protein [Acidimicrobiaceae bacterium]MDQ1465283.1 hypothetical protein [Actinomycetota bacterium]MDQ1541055.1 hypothetical protein [Actinomycetota bacterium]
MRKAVPIMRKTVWPFVLVTAIPICVAIVVVSMLREWLWT